MKENHKFVELYNLLCVHIGDDIEEWITNNYNGTIAHRLYKAIYKLYPKGIQEIEVKNIWKKYNEPNKEFTAKKWNQDISELKTKMENYLLFLELDNPRKFVETMNSVYPLDKNTEESKSKFQRYIRLNKLYNRLGKPMMFDDMLSDFKKVCATTYQKYMYERLEMEIVLQKEKDINVRKEKALILVTSAFTYFFEQIFFFILYILSLNKHVELPFEIDKFINILQRYKNKENKNPFAAFLDIYAFMSKSAYTNNDVHSITQKLETISESHTIAYKTDMWSMLFNRVNNSANVNNTITDIQNLYFLIAYAIQKKWLIKDDKYMLQHYPNVVKTAWKYSAIHGNNAISKEVVAVINQYHATYNLYLHANIKVCPKEKLLLLMCSEMDNWDKKGVKRFDIFVPNHLHSSKSLNQYGYNQETKTIIERYRKSFEKGNEIAIRPFFYFMENRYIYDDTGISSDEDMNRVNENLQKVKEILEAKDASSQKEKLQFEYEVWQLLIAICQMKDEEMKEKLAPHYQKMEEVLSPHSLKFCYNKSWYYSSLTNTWENK